jgi:hypothetical protein
MLYEFDGRKPVLGSGTYVSEAATGFIYIDLARKYLEQGMKGIVTP